MGKYYYIDEYGKYHCNCGFRTGSFMGIQSHIRVHKKHQEAVDKKIQTTLDAVIA